MENSQAINGHLSEILLAQDLTGQVIQGVTNLVRDVEQRLVGLVAMAGHIDKISGVAHKELSNIASEDTMKGVGPQVNTNVKDVVDNQDNVNDLLSSLEFYFL